MQAYETESIDRLFLELAQFTMAKTPMEAALQDRLDRITREIEKIVITQGEDSGVVLLSGEGKTQYDEKSGGQVFVHEHISPLGDALVGLWKITQED